MTKHSLPAFVLLLTMISPTSPQLQADNWPGWRGPAQDGHTCEKDIPIHWSANENVLWKTPISGVGHSSPIVWEDAIFVTTCDTDKLSRRLLKVQRGSGTVEWDIEIAVSPIEKMHRDNTPASATPITDGQHVFVVFMVNDGLEVTAVDFAGEKVWKRRVGEFESAHGFCTNLVLDGDHLFLSGLQDGPDAFVASLDKHTGDILWKVPRTKKVRSFSTPYLCTIQDQPALILSGAEQTAAYDRQTGETIWEIDGPGSKTVSSVVACNESHLAFVCGGRDNLFYALGMSATETSDSKLPTVAWESKKGIPYMTSPLLSNGKLHILSDEGVYRCYDPATGKVLKELRAVGPVKSSMIANKDHIYMTEVSGRTTVIKNDATWTVVAENDLNEEVVASPAVSNGMLIIRTVSHLVAIADSRP